MCIPHQDTGVLSGYIRIHQDTCARIRQNLTFRIQIRIRQDTQRTSVSRLCHAWSTGLACQGWVLFGSIASTQVHALSRMVPLTPRKIADRTAAVTLRDLRRRCASMETWRGELLSFWSIRCHPFGSACGMRFSDQIEAWCLWELGALLWAVALGIWPWWVGYWRVWA